MEGLHVSIQDTCDKSLIQGVKLPRGGPIVSHKFYADDAIFAGNWDMGSIKNLSRILKCFEISSDLKVNYHKSRLFGIRTSDSKLHDMAQIIGCLKSSFPFSYIGVPIGANMLLNNNWKPIVEKFQSNLSNRKANALSFRGQLTLIKSVLGSLPTYYLYLFNAPHGILDTLERMRMRFLWGGTDMKNKIHWVKWAKVVADKKESGLGVGALKAQNVTILTKW